jgi:hypothetical protein
MGGSPGIPPQEAGTWSDTSTIFAIRGSISDSTDDDCYRINVIAPVTVDIVVGDSLGNTGSCSVAKVGVVAFNPTEIPTDANFWTPPDICASFSPFAVSAEGPGDPHFLVKVFHSGFLTPPADYAVKITAH